jgi:hypothetical protein
VPPADATPLALPDDGSSAALPLGFSFHINGETYDEIYLASNGFLSFSALPEQRYFTPGCLPVPETDEPAIVPFRADLDPSQGGTVTAAQVAQGFVVSFDDVPLHSSDPTTAPRYTFQVLLARDGHIVMNYRNLDELPTHIAAGIQYDAEHVQSMGCNDGIPLDSFLTIEFIPQPDSLRWIRLSGTTENTLFPDQKSGVAIILNSTAHNIPSRLFRGAVLFESNDPRQPVVRVPIQVRNGPAPHGIYVPLITTTGP